jgi:hypothetical protein
LQNRLIAEAIKIHNLSSRKKWKIPYLTNRKD